MGPAELLLRGASAIGWDVLLYKSVCVCACPLFLSSMYDLFRLITERARSHLLTAGRALLNARLRG